MKRVTKLRENNPELLSNDEVVGLAIEADKLQELSTIYSTPEGKTLVKVLLKDYLLKAQRLQGVYKEKEPAALIPLVASMEATWDIAKLLATSDELLKYLDSELNDALHE